MSIPLRIDHTAGLRSHNDIHVTVGAYARDSDSYYLALDAERAESATVDTVMVTMLSRWLKDLRSLTIDAPTVYFPVDLSDECSGWVATDLTGDESVTVEFGWTGLEGWAFMPSAYADSVDRLQGWKAVESSRFECALPDLLTAVDAIKVHFSGSER